MHHRRQQLVYQLNSSGKYFAFKEQLKHAVVKIVREKYLRTANFKDRDELQVLISLFYFFFISQNKLINKKQMKTAAIHQFIFLLCDCNVYRCVWPKLSYTFMDLLGKKNISVFLTLIVLCKSPRHE